MVINRKYIPHSYSAGVKQEETQIVVVIENRVQGREESLALLRTYFRTNKVKRVLRLPCPGIIISTMQDYRCYFFFKYGKLEFQGDQ